MTRPSLAAGSGSACSSPVRSTLHFLWWLRINHRKEPLMFWNALRVFPFGSRRIDRGSRRRRSAGARAVGAFAATILFTLCADSGAAIINVNNGDNLQSKIDLAVPGDTLVLAAGASFDHITL